VGYKSYTYVRIDGKTWRKEKLARPNRRWHDSVKICVLRKYDSKAWAGFVQLWIENMLGKL
jgi:hypothetical protein